MDNTFVAVYLFIYFFVLCGDRNTSDEKKKKTSIVVSIRVRVLITGCDGRPCL
jgi:hypothetical protein